jgi:transcriptional regulator with XRE-family HTH domain
VENIRRILSDQLASRRKRKGWTQFDLAAAIGRKPASVRGYEQMKRWPGPVEFEALAAALDCTPADLLGDQKVEPETALKVLQGLVESARKQGSS